MSNNWLTVSHSIEVCPRCGKLFARQLSTARRAPHSGAVWDCTHNLAALIIINQSVHAFIGLFIQSFIQSVPITANREHSIHGAAQLWLAVALRQKQHVWNAIAKFRKRDAGNACKNYSQAGGTKQLCATARYPMLSLSIVAQIIDCECTPNSSDSSHYLARPSYIYLICCLSVSIQPEANN